MINTYSIATLGGHSALEICLGAKRLGFKTVVIVQTGRDKVYTKYYQNLVDKYLLVDSFKNLTQPDPVQFLKENNTIFIPHRYCQVYLNLEVFEKKFPISIFGNKYLLKYEEREGIFNQYQILDNAQIPYPLQFKNPEEIDRLCLVKVKEASRDYERAFFFARNFLEFKKKSQQFLKEEKITEEDLKKAVIEEYLIGAQVNFNFFYSPLEEKLQLLGTDVRRQTNIDGLIRVPPLQLQDLKETITPSYIESGHVAVTVKESLLEAAFYLGEKLLTTLKTFADPGIIGPFALQTAIIPGPPKEKIIVYDLSLRMPGSPGIIATPYSLYHYGRPVSFGERIAMEIKKAITENSLGKILT